MVVPCLFFWIFPRLGLRVDEVDDVLDGLEVRAHLDGAAEGVLKGHDQLDRVQGVDAQLLEGGLGLDGGHVDVLVLGDDLGYLFERHGKFLLAKDVWMDFFM